MILFLLLAVLTGLFVWKRWWGAAMFTAMVWVYFLWMDLLVLLNAMWVGQRMGF